MLFARQDDSPPEHHHPHAPLVRCSAIGGSVFSGRLRRRPRPSSAPATPDLGWGASVPYLCEGFQRRRSSEIFQSQKSGRGGGRDRGQGRRGCRQRCGLAQRRPASAPPRRMLESHIGSASERHSHRFASARWGCRPSTRCAVAERGPAPFRCPSKRCQIPANS